MQSTALPVPGYPAYSVNPQGEVFRNGSPAPLRKNPGRSVKLRFRHKGVQVELGLAKLVAQLFIPNPHNHTSVIFKDGNNHNCNADNIQWAGKQQFTRYIHRKNQPPAKKCISKENIAAAKKSIPSRPDSAEEDARHKAVPVPGFPGYSVTPDGKVFSPSRLLHGIQSPNKAPRVKMTNTEGRSIRLALSTIVALTFIPNPQNHPKTIFKDRDKTNCTVENLEWVSASECTRFIRADTESYDLLGPPRCRKTRNHAWIDPDRVPIEGFPNYYISPKGIVYKKDRIIKPVAKKGRSLKIRIHPSGWPRDKHLTFGLAKLVAEHFIPNPKRHKHIIFKDRNNHNCTVENIAWVDGETFTYYSGISIGAKKKVVDRQEAIRTCRDQYLREYYKTLDETWLHYCWEEIEKKITVYQWDEFRTDCYMYFIDRAKRFSITRDPVGLLLCYIKGLQVKLRKEISPDMSSSLVRKTDESLRILRSSRTSESTYDNW